MEKIKLTASVDNLRKSSRPRKLNASAKAFIEAQMRKNDEATSRQKNKRSFSSMAWKFIPQLWSKYQTHEFHSYAMRLFSREYCVNKCICRCGISIIIFHFIKDMPISCEYQHNISVNSANIFELTGRKSKRFFSLKRIKTLQA